MFSVYQHWDPLKVCAVGRTYPPEFYSGIKNPRVRNVLERIAIETEEDYQKLIAKLEEFNVTVLRTDLSENPEDYHTNGVLNVPPPMTPRDHTAMVGNTFYMPGDAYGDNLRWIEDEDLAKKIEDYLEPDNKVSPKESLIRMKERIKLGSKNIYRMDVGDKKLSLKPYNNRNSILIQEIISSETKTIGSNFKFPNNKAFDSFTTIRKFLQNNNVPIKYDTYINTAVMTRVGKDLYFTTTNIIDDLNRDTLKKKYDEMFPEYRVHLLKIGGHIDAAFCPVVPNLIISIDHIQTYNDTFPDWEVIHLKGESWSKVRKWMKLKKKNHGKWWIPGEEDNDDLTYYVETWLKDWVTYVEETVFDVNMLVIDQNNVIVNNYNKKAFDAFERYNVTPHIINFRHRYFWDGGIHCITSDIAREGKCNNYFEKHKKNPAFYTGFLKK